MRFRGMVLGWRRQFLVAEARVARSERAAWYYEDVLRARAGDDEARAPFTAPRRR